MDQRLKTVLEDVHHINSINNHKRLLKEQFHEAITVYYNGGRFTATTSFISFLGVIEEHNISIITDDNDIPVEIKDVSAFKSLVLDTYKEATKTYIDQYENAVANSRSLEEMLEL